MYVKIDKNKGRKMISRWDEKVIDIFNQDWLNEVIETDEQEKIPYTESIGHNTYYKESTGIIASIIKEKLKNYSVANFLLLQTNENRMEKIKELIERFFEGDFEGEQNKQGVVDRIFSASKNYLFKNMSKEMLSDWKSMQLAYIISLNTNQLLESLERKEIGEYLVNGDENVINANLRSKGPRGRAELWNALKFAEVLKNIEGNNVFSIKQKSGEMEIDLQYTNRRCVVRGSGYYSGWTYECANLAWREIPLDEAFKKEVDNPVYIDVLKNLCLDNLGLMHDLAKIYPEKPWEIEYIENHRLEPNYPLIELISSGKGILDVNYYCDEYSLKRVGKCVEHLLENPELKKKTNWEKLMGSLANKQLEKNSIVNQLDFYNNMKGESLPLLYTIKKELVMGEEVDVLKVDFIENLVRAYSAKNHDTVEVMKKTKNGSTVKVTDFFGLKRKVIGMVEALCSELDLVRGEENITYSIELYKKSDKGCIPLSKELIDDIIFVLDQVKNVVLLHNHYEVEQILSLLDDKKMREAVPVAPVKKTKFKF